MFKGLNVRTAAGINIRSAISAIMDAEEINNPREKTCLNEEKSNPREDKKKNSSCGNESTGRFIVGFCQTFVNIAILF